MLVAEARAVGETANGCRARAPLEAKIPPTRQSPPCQRLRSDGQLLPNRKERGAPAPWDSPSELSLQRVLPRFSWGLTLLHPLLLLDVFLLHLLRLLLVSLLHLLLLSLAGVLTLHFLVFL